MSATLKHEDPVSRFSNAADDGKVIAGGPTAPGSYPSTPLRITVRTADPHIEQYNTPAQLPGGVNAKASKPLLQAAENGTGRA